MGYVTGSVTSTCETVRWAHTCAPDCEWPYNRGGSTVQYMHPEFFRLLLSNQTTADGRDGSPSHLCRRVAALVEGGLLSHNHRSEV